MTKHNDDISRGLRAVNTLGAHQGDGIRYSMHLSAPAGGSAQMLRTPDGEWVAWEDYARLKAEVARLTKAGNAMHTYMHRIAKDVGLDDDWDEVQIRWETAAREGQQP